MILPADSAETGSTEPASKAGMDRSKNRGNANVIVPEYEMSRSRPFIHTVSLFGCAAIVCLAGIAHAQPRRGPVSSSNIVPAPTGNSSAPLNPALPAPPANIEHQHHQDLREDRLAAMERILKSRVPGFQTADEVVKAKSGTPPTPAMDTSKLSKELKLLADTAKNVIDARRALSQFPTLPLDINTIVGDFDKAVDAIGKVDKNVLAADLLMVGLATAEKAALVKAQPANLLPILLKSFVGQLGIGDLLGAVQQAEVPAVKATELQKFDAKLGSSVQKLNALVK